MSSVSIVIYSAPIIYTLCTIQLYIIICLVYIYNLKWYNYAYDTNYTLSIPITLGNTYIQTHCISACSLFIAVMYAIRRGKGSTPNGATAHA